ncbi:hypothetical protein M1N12_03120 [Peptococcaceae bacterium]|nr:hypothetical protein [Peptococcaceae bacterium]MCL0106674.1 hypothetical protein [Peptococcaceae bacterium]
MLEMLCTLLSCTVEHHGTIGVDTIRAYPAGEHKAPDWMYWMLRIIWGSIFTGVGMTLGAKIGNFIFNPSLSKGKWDSIGLFLALRKVKKEEKLQWIVISALLALLCFLGFIVLMVLLFILLEQQLSISKFLGDGYFGYLLRYSICYLFSLMNMYIFVWEDRVVGHFVIVPLVMFIAMFIMSFLNVAILSWLIDIREKRKRI